MPITIVGGSKGDARPSGRLPQGSTTASLHVAPAILFNDDERLTSDELAAVVVGEQEIAEGDFVTLEELERSLKSV